jgi:hypothetical protein
VPKTAGLTGVTGEHYVAAELSRRGFLVTLTRGNAPGVDLLAYDPESRRTVACQVKTADGSRGKRRVEWMLKQGDDDPEKVRSDFFIFVFLPADSAPPEFRIVPSKTVAHLVHEDHSQWLSTPGRRGQQHSTENTIRIFRDAERKWLGNWDLILNAAKARRSAAD